MYSSVTCILAFVEFQVSSGGSVRTELIEEDGETRYKIIDVIGILAIFDIAYIKSAH